MLNFWEAASTALLTKAAVLVMFCVFVLIFLNRRLYNALYAYLLSRLDRTMSKSQTINEIKTNLFSSMKPGSYIVEIGAGSGANMQFFPAMCTLKCIEPKVEFKSYNLEAVKQKGKHLQTVEFIQGCGEKLSSVVKANSVDCVVCTMVLCSVEDVLLVASEARRVLKSGGTFFFFEHVYAPEDRPFVRLYHRLMTPMFRILADNCHFNREPWKAIEAAGFSSISYRRQELTKTFVFSPIHWICFGTASK